MRWLTFEHSPVAYRVDFCLYGALLLTLCAGLLATSPDVMLAAWVLAGAWGWTLLEYLLHRFVLHGLPPFKRWHAEHHRRPKALIAAPTLLSMALFANLLLPAVWLIGARAAAALAIGLMGGYLGYGLIHHAMHWLMRPSALRVGRRWLLQRRVWHGLHHRRLPGSGSAASALHGYYGVSTTFWDRVFRSDRRVTSAACRSPRW